MPRDASFITGHDLWLKFREELSGDAESAGLLGAEGAKCLMINRISVVDNPLPKRGGAPNDYVSQAPYWWPDPEKPDGLPYIRRDGKTNPEHYESDRARIEWLCDTVTCLILWASSSGAERAACHAGKLLRCWFIDPATRMNPHLRYAQFIPGICEGRGIGLIDTGPLCHLLDALHHLPFNGNWTPADLDGLKAWMAEYLDWLLESEPGRDECGQHNNHGMWYDAQVASFAIFCGRPETARRHIEAFTFSRIDSQIGADGSQPHELARTLSMSYCTFNLTGLAILAQLARQVGIDLWHRQRQDGHGIIPAIRWMLPYCLGEKAWRHRQIETFSRPSAAYLLSLAAQGTGDGEFALAADRLSAHPWNKISSWRTGIRKFTFPANS